MTDIGLFAGIRLYSSNHAVVQFRFPRTKKRRIRKKWAKRPENFRPIPYFLHLAGVGYIGHPVTIERLRLSVTRK